MFKIRNAQLEDSKAIYDLRMSPEVRNISLDNSTFTYESHLSWFSRALQNPLKELFVVLKDDDFGGVIRFDLNEKLSEALVSIFIDKKYWGSGISSYALNKAEEALKQKHPSLKTLTAQVIMDNVGSQKFFAKMNYKQQMIQFKKEL